MISSIEIRDVAGGQAPGCTATFTIRTEQESGTTRKYIDATAVPAAGYEFVRWEYDYYTQVIYYGDPSDPTYHYGVISTANPSGNNIYDADDDVEVFGARYKRVTTRVVAIFKRTTPPTQDSAIYLSLVSNPAGVGSLSGGGLRTGAIGSSVSCSVLAEVKDASKDSYRFSHWIDDDGVRYSLKQFSKSFSFKSGYTESNPEQKIFTAYFVPIRGTGLILRSSSSGLILRGKANRILRDE